MESKKINQLATNVSPQTTDLTIIGDPTTGVSKKITLLQIANLFSTIGTVSSVAVTETGDALTITGSPITSAGTINIGFAGDATQYVRGDGALADFPTSTGGGSSVSYYLNSSVSQGTIGGVAYRELSKDPISGAGTDITISADGYIASYITDANDPALLEVPGGNFNCEFYFSVNSNAHNPYVYAELYKYDGTTFTLLGSSQSVPEYLTNGTTLSPYYFAIPVATSVLTITDRLAIRIYANVDTRTVTLHTENNHLCQVVTTFSKGLTSLNNLTRQVQFLATGTSGTDFAISSSVATHTFNLPVASAANTGKLSSTDWSTFNNKLSTATAASTYVPYTGATTNVDLGINNINAYNFTIQPSGYALLAALSRNLTGSGFGILNLRNGSNGFIQPTTLSVDRTYTLPDASGTIALVGGSGVGTVTSVAALTLGTTGTDLSSSVANGTTTPVITLNVPTASATNRGALSSADWTTFNNKQNALTNPVTGTGNAGYISLFTGTSAIGNSIIFQSGTSVGIMNASPTTTLDVTGGGKFSGSISAAGATLTGALSGTSATFSSSTNGEQSLANNNSNSGSSAISVFNLQNNVSVGQLVYTSSTYTGGYDGIGANTYALINRSSTGSFKIITGGFTDAQTRLTISSTGAATFSSSIAATSATFSSSVTAGDTITINTPSSSTAIALRGRSADNFSAIRFQSNNGSSTYATIYSNASDLILENGGSERARITSGGNLLVGTTSSVGRLTSYSQTAALPAIFCSSNFSGDVGYTAMRIDKFDNNSSTSQVFINFSIGNNSNANGQINGNGGGAVAFGSWSDKRLKENIIDLPPQLNNILSLRPVEFDYIESEGGAHQTGFIAQEMQEVYPDAVGERQDGMLTVTGWSKTEARLVKAIQELEARIKQLENK